MLKHIKIGGNIVEIVFQEWSIDKMGACHVPPNKIYINTTLSKNQQESVLLHEILEYINDSCDLGLSHSQVSTLETMLYQVVQDNFTTGEKLREMYGGYEEGALTEAGIEDAGAF